MNAMHGRITKGRTSTRRAAYCALLVSLTACRGDTVAPSTQRDATRVRAMRPPTSRGVERVVYVEQVYDGPVSPAEAQAVKRLLAAMPALDRPSVEQALDEERRFGWRLGFPNDAKLQELLDAVRAARRDAQSGRSRSRGLR